MRALSLRLVCLLSLAFSIPSFPAILCSSIMVDFVPLSFRYVSVFRFSVPFLSSFFLIASGIPFVLRLYSRIRVALNQFFAFLLFVSLLLSCPSSLIVVVLNLFACLSPSFLPYLALVCCGIVLLCVVPPPCCLYVRCTLQWFVLCWFAMFLFVFSCCGSQSSLQTRKLVSWCSSESCVCLSMRFLLFCPCCSFTISVSLLEGLVEL